MKTIVFVSDLHCGSLYGLTPSAWHTRQSRQHYRYQREAWGTYLDMCRRWNRPDILVCVGDAINGAEAKQGGAELICVDRNQQVQMATIALEQWEAKRVVMVYGTAYHVGQGAEDYEYNIAKNLDASIEGHMFLKAEGLVFDIKHKIGTSSVPYGRSTAISREVVWALIKEAKSGWPKVDVVVRGHAHYFRWVEEAGKTAFICPSLQLARGRYGSREMSGDVDWGMIRLTVDNGKIIGRDINICTLAANKPRILKVG
jgi:predicted phosphodiesterase